MATSFERGKPKVGTSKRRGQRKRQFWRLRLLTSEKDNAKEEKPLPSSVQNLKEEVELNRLIEQLTEALKEKNDKITLLENEVKDANQHELEYRADIMSRMERYKHNKRNTVIGLCERIGDLNKEIENLKIDHEIVLKKKDAELDKLQLANKKLEESLAAINNVEKTPATKQVNKDGSILKDKPTPIEQLRSTCEQNDSETSDSDCMEVDLVVGCLDKKKGTGSTATLGLPKPRRTPTRSLVNSGFKDPKPTPRRKPNVSPKAKKPKTPVGALTRRRGPQDCLSPARIIKNTKVQQPLTSMTEKPFSKFTKTPPSAINNPSDVDTLLWFDRESVYGFNK